MRRELIAVVAVGVASSALWPAVTLSADDRPAGTGDALYDAAFARAEAITGGEQLGSTVNVLGVLGGDELDAYLTAYEPFEAATGIEIEFEGTRDMQAVLQTRVDGGNPPDVISTAAIGQLQDLAADGEMVALDEILDMEAMAAEFDQGLLDLGTGADGHLYGVFGTAAVKGLIYHNTSVYDGPTEDVTWDELNEWAESKAVEGVTPWCIGLEAGAASGWPATDWIELFLLNQAGPDVYDAWWRGELPWTSPEIKAAYEAFGAIATDDTLVYGGTDAVVSTPFGEAADPLFADPPGCLVSNQADFLAQMLAANVEGAVPGETLDVFAFPTVNADYAGTVEIAGEMVGVMVDSPQTRAYIEYTVSAERQSITASTGRWLAPNRTVDTAVYESPIAAKAAAVLASASIVRFDASDLMPAAVNEAFWRSTLDYVTGAADLDDLLADLEQARADESG